MEVLVILWYGWEELIYWLWWALTGKKLDFYEKCNWAQIVFWGGLLACIIVGMI